MGLLFPATARAQNAHFVGAVTCRVATQGTATTVDDRVVCTGKIAGLGDNETITVSFETTVIAEIVCINPGGNRAPGQDQTLTVTGTGTFTSDKNGNVVFRVVSSAPTLSSPSAGCPNEHWRAVIVGLTFPDEEVTVVVQHAEGTLRRTVPLQQ